MNNDYVAAWQGQDFYPRGNPIANLSEAQRALLLTKYQEAIAEFVTDKGIWQDSTTLYVQTIKS